MRSFSRLTSFLFSSSVEEFAHNRLSGWGGLTRFDGHLSLEVLLPRKDVCDASCETAGVPA